MKILALIILLIIPAAELKAQTAQPLKLHQSKFPPDPYFGSFPGELIIITTYSTSETGRLCDRPEKRLFGCAQRSADGRRCTIWLLDYAAGLREGWDIDVRTLRYHEEAHCNGWPADHPGGR
jgi:hypothetical protein